MKANLQDPFEAELERIRQTYAGYDRDPEVQRRWDDENAGNHWNFEHLVRALRKMLEDHHCFPAPGQRVLEVGCGDGGILGLLRGFGLAAEDLYGIDLLESRITAARKNLPGVQFVSGRADRLPYEAAAFDLVVQITMFSSILDHGMVKAIATEIDRTLKPGGHVLSYDLRYPNPFNKNVRAIPVTELREAFPGYECDVRSLTLLPQLARRIGTLPALCSAIYAFPFMRTHNLVLMKKPSR